MGQSTSLWSSLPWFDTRHRGGGGSVVQVMWMQCAIQFQLSCLRIPTKELWWEVPKNAKLGDVGNVKWDILNIGSFLACGVIVVGLSALVYNHKYIRGTQYYYQIK